MLAYLDVTETISLITAILFLILKEINILIIVLLWYHLLKGIVVFFLDYILWDGYFNIGAIIDISIGLFVFFRDMDFAIPVLKILMVVLLIKSLYNMFSPADKIFGEE